MAGGVRVSLSSGDHFYVEAELLEVLGRLEKSRRLLTHFVYLGSRLVNPVQVAELRFERDVPSVEVVETLED